MKVISPHLIVLCHKKDVHKIKSKDVQEGPRGGWGVGGEQILQQFNLKMPILTSTGFELKTSRVV